MSKKKILKKFRFFKSLVVSKLIFSKRCKNIFEEKNYPRFHWLFMRKRTSWILEFLPKNPSWQSVLKRDRTPELSKIANIRPLLTSCYPTSRRRYCFEKKIFFYGLRFISIFALKGS